MDLFKAYGIQSEISNIYITKDHKKFIDQDLAIKHQTHLIELEHLKEKISKIEKDDHDLMQKSRI